MIDKISLRKQVIATRNTLDSATLHKARDAVRTHVLQRAATLPSGSRIACYEPLRTEPGSTELLAALDASGFDVIVPVTLPDKDLDWVRWSPATADTDGARELLGTDAISGADLVLVPAFAVDSAGRRLGRGGGSYDRALLRVRSGVPVAAMLFDCELVAEVPVEPWDRPVSAVVSPSGWRDVQPFPAG